LYSGSLCSLPCCMLKALHYITDSVTSWLNLPCCWWSAELPSFASYVRSFSLFQRYYCVTNTRWCVLWWCTVYVPHSFTVSKWHQPVYHTLIGTCIHIKVVWRSDSALVLINEANLRRARLVLGWVTVSSFDSRGRHFISVCNQPASLIQPSTLCGMVKWVAAKGQWCSAVVE